MEQKNLDVETLNICVNVLESLCHGPALASRSSYYAVLDMQYPNIKAVSFGDVVEERKLRKGWF